MQDNTANVKIDFDFDDAFISTYTISFENLSNNARRKLQPMLQKAITTSSLKAIQMVSGEQLSK